MKTLKLILLAVLAAGLTFQTAYAGMGGPGKGKADIEEKHQKRIERI